MGAIVHVTALMSRHTNLPATFARLGALTVALLEIAGSCLCIRIHVTKEISRAALAVLRIGVNAEQLFCGK